MPRLFPTTTVRLLALAEMLTSIAEIAIRIPVAVTAIRLLGETPSSPGAVSSVYGYMFAMVALPCVLFVGAFGHLVDSSPHTRLKLILRGTVFGRVVTTAGLVAIAFMANRGGTFGVVPLFVILFADFTLASLFEPALHRLVPGVVDERHLSRTNASLSFSGWIGYVVGPIIGGFLTEWSTPGVALLVSAILYGFSGILLTRLLHTCAIHIPPPDKKALTVPWHDLFWQSGTIGWVLGSYSMMGLTAGLVSGIVPAIVASHVGPSVSDLGAVWTASGLGTLMGGRSCWHTPNISTPCALEHCWHCCSEGAESRLFLQGSCTGLFA